MVLEDITSKILQTNFRISNILGYGFLENVTDGTHTLIFWEHGSARRRKDGHPDQFFC